MPAAHVDERRETAGDGVSSAPGRPTRATRRELESCSIWAPKMVEAPTKYPSQWGTDGKVWETDV